MLGDPAATLFDIPLHTAPVAAPPDSQSFDDWINLGADDTSVIDPAAAAAAEAPLEGQPAADISADTLDDTCMWLSANGLLPMPSAIPAAVAADLDSASSSSDDDNDSYASSVDEGAPDSGDDDQAATPICEAPLVRAPPYIQLHSLPRSTHIN